MARFLLMNQDGFVYCAQIQTKKLSSVFIFKSRHRYHTLLSTLEMSRGVLKHNKNRLLLGDTTAHFLWEGRKCEATRRAKEGQHC